MTVYEPDVVERFWQQVEQGDGCWLFTGKARNSSGKPLFEISRRPQRTRVVAQRVAYDLRVGEVEGQVHNSCGNDLCVRPDHLVVGARRLHPDFAGRRAEAFWQRVRRGPDECWPWTDTDDHRNTTVAGKLAGVHVHAWTLTYGDPGGRFVCHRCDNPPCCNPAHLFLGTPAENSADMAGKGRAKTGQRRRALTDEQVREIRRLYAEGGKSTHELAPIYGVTAMTIWKVAAGKTYRDVA